MRLYQRGSTSDDGTDLFNAIEEGLEIVEPESTPCGDCLRSVSSPEQPMWIPTQGSEHCATCYWVPLVLINGRTERVDEKVVLRLVDVSVIMLSHHYYVSRLAETHKKSKSCPGTPPRSERMSACVLSIIDQY